jgi:predicted dehydrogenase
MIDVRTDELAQTARQYGIPYFRSLADALKQTQCDPAVLAVPHHLHYELTSQLLAHGKHVIKEKPFAIRLAEAQHLVCLAQANSVKVFTIVQRSHRDVFILAQNRLASIGAPHSFKYEYYKSLSEPPQDWRARRQLCGGGVVLDMGFHILDIILRWFGSPSHLSAQLGYYYSQTRAEALEDYASIVLDYVPMDLRGTVLLSRHHCCKAENLEIRGAAGTMMIRPQGYRIYSTTGDLVEEYTDKQCEPEARIIMFENYLSGLQDNEYFDRELDVQLRNVTLIEQIYASALLQ